MTTGSSAILAAIQAYGDGLDVAKPLPVVTMASDPGAGKRMHEVGLMEQALEAALATTRRAGAVRIHRLRLRVGALSGVEPEALRLAFAALAPRTSAAGADLVIELVPVMCVCPSCEMKFTPSDFIFACPACGALSADVTLGRNLELASVEVS